MKTVSIGIVGPATLLGKELASALATSRFPALSPRLLDPPGEPGASPETVGEHRLTAFGDEAGLTDAFSAAAVADLDLVFLACSEEEARQAIPVLEAARVRVVDLNAQPHPAAEALVHLLDRLELVGPLHAVATIFEPASERGWPGIQELEQQTTRALAAQPLPTDIFGGQVAFNLLPAPDGLRRRIAADLERLRGGARRPAFTVLQAPVFHAALLSVYVRYERGSAEAGVVLRAVGEALGGSPWLQLGAPGESAPDVLAVAGEDRIHLARPQADEAGGLWLWAALDNLRRTATGAVEAALAQLAERA